MTRLAKLLGIFLVSVAVAGAALPGNVAAAGHSPEDASKFVQSVGEEALAIIKDQSASKTERQKKLESVFASRVDIPWIGRFVLGRFWRQANEQQRKDYMREYERFLISHYTTRFADHSGGDFKVISSKSDNANQFVVSMEILSTGESEPILVDYRIHAATDGQLRIFDVIVEGVSMITTQRSEFNAVIAQKGMDELIQQLAGKTEALKGQRS